MGNNNEYLKLVCWTGLPGSGKTTGIELLRKLPKEEREKFHLGEIILVNEFLVLKEKFFLADDKREKKTQERLYSDKLGANSWGLKDPALVFKLLDQELSKILLLKLKEIELVGAPKTIFFEFSRGKSHTYKQTFNAFPNELLEQLVILYNHVSFKISCNRNLERAKKENYSDEHHIIPKNIMESFFIEDFWQETCRGQEQGYLTFNNTEVAFYNLRNEEDIDDVNDEKKFLSKIQSAFERFKNG